MADVKKIKVQVGADTKELDKGMKKAEKSVSKFSSQVKKLGGAMVAAFSVGIIFRFGKALLTAADIQQKAETSLLVALDGRRQVQQRLIKQAQELQKLTLFGDEETIRAQSLIAAFVKEEEAITRIIPLVQDMAAAKGMQLANAADLVSKTLGSSTNAMSRYGIEVVGAVGSTERLTSLVNGLTKAFEGQAAAAAAVDLTFTQLQNRIGDIKESMGVGLHKAIVGISDVIDLKFRPSIFYLNQWTGTLNEELGKLFEWQSKMIEVNERLNRLSNLKLENLRKEIEYMKLMSQVRKADPFIEPVGFEAFFSRGQQGERLLGLDFSQDPKIKTGFQAVAEMATHMREQTDAWLTEMHESINSDVLPDVAKMNDSMMNLGQTIGVQLVTQFASLGDAIGRALSGAEDAINSLGQAILQNLGSLLMMAGLQAGPAGIGLVIAGAAIQLGSGIWRGSQTQGQTSVLPQSNVQFFISGNGLAGQQRRYTTFKDIVT